jgi:5-methyltetrahydrofolate--homocysteine methyltransferase
MRTVLRSAKQEVAIDKSARFVVIGEKINPSVGKRLAVALRERNYDYVRELARKQVAAGADVLDVNVGLSDADEVRLLPETVRIITEVVEIPVCIDSQSPAALAAALSVTPGKPLVNSTDGQEASLQAVLPVVKDYGAAVVGLTMDEDGIPINAEGRLAIAEKILEKASRMGVPAEDVVVDPLVLSVGADSNAAVVTLRAIARIRKTLGVNISLGASNVSFGLPDRHSLNQAFLALAIGAGATCAITDPTKMTTVVRAVDLLMGRDRRAMRYLRHWRARQGSEPG